MKGYRERDYAFGQLVLTLRSTLGLTQAGLATCLGISRRAVAEWETGNNYPKAERLKAFIELGVHASAFPAGHEEEQIRTLWKAARQKLILDEQWLDELFKKHHPQFSLVAPATKEPSLLPAARDPQADWGQVLAASTFYGRQRELATLSQWILQERSRVVSVLGMGGIGKSALVTSLLSRLAPHFERVYWRSLRDAPSYEGLLDELLQQFSSPSFAQSPASLEHRLSLVVDHLRTQRTLLVLDNLEALLEEGKSTGHMRPGYQGYAQLLHRLAETQHQSTVLLTSREKPSVLAPLEGTRTQVRSLRLSGLDLQASRLLLQERNLFGTIQDAEKLIQAYAGNPLALKIVASTIAELFGGEIALFLTGSPVVFGGIRQLLHEQFDRLSPGEQTVLSWLAILREPVTLKDLLAVLGTPLSRSQVLEAVEALRGRSLLERGRQPASFTLQSVVLEYATARLIEEAAREIEEGRLSRLIEQGLELALSKEYVRQTQQRLLVAPLLEQLYCRYQAREELEQRLLALLSQLRERADYAQGYGPANVLALLRLQSGHLRSLDLSRLVLRGVYLQGVEMQDAKLSGALIQESVLTETFDAIWAVAISQSGQYWAAAGRRGEVRLWRGAGQTLHRVWQAHTDIATTLAFSPDERLFASGSTDGSVKLWDVESGAALWSGGQASTIICVSFACDGGLLASGGLDATVRLWNPKLGTLLQEVPHPGPVSALAWSPDGHLLATGDDTGTIRLWEIGPSSPAICVESLVGHSSWVWGLAFAPDGRTLASASWDGSVKLWELGEAGSLCVCQTLVGHMQQVQPVAWSPDGGTLASGSWDHTIRLWDAQQGSARVVLQGHRAAVHGLAFTPDSRSLLSGSQDGTLRLWEVERGQCVRVLQGYDACLYDLDWSPDGTQLASAGSDSVVSLWQVASSGGGAPRGVLRGHDWSVYGVAWRPDGGVLASSGWDNTIRLWDPATGSCLEVIGDRDHPDTLFWGLAWSPDGKLLASATLSRGVLVWEGTTGAGRWIGREQPIWIRRVAWSPDGTRLVAVAEDGYVYVWNASDGTLLRRLAGHDREVWSVAFSPDGTWLASAGGGKGRGELFVWDVQSGELLHAFEPGGVVYALAWSPTGVVLHSGGSDGMLRWWDVRRRECVRVQQAHQGTVQALKVSPDGSRLASCGNDGTIRLWDLESGHSLDTLRRDRPYERLNITGIRGLTQAEIATLHALGAVEDEADEQSSRPDQADWL